VRFLFVPLVALLCGCGFFPEVGALRSSDQDAAPSPTVPGTNTPPPIVTDAGADADAAVEVDSGGTTGPRTHTINVGPGDREIFQPSALTIKAGDEVRWLFSSNGHNVVGQGGAWCSPNNTNCGSPPELDRGAVYMRVFPTAGTFAYSCASHDDDNMRGTITVTP